jgi:hypothetical protein
MDRGIDVDNVNAVLLSDGWHDVVGGSFNLASYEYYRSVHGRRKIVDPDQPAEVVHRAGASGITAAGFSFKTAGGSYIAGPLSAVLAVRCRP